MDFEPFSAADNIRLQRLSNGLSELQGQVDDGTLEPWEAEPHLNGIQAQMGPLRQKQQQSQMMQQRMVQEAQQHEAAHVQSIEHANAAFQAQNFQDRVATYTDPLSGKSAHMVQDGKGHWERIEFPGEEGSSSAVEAGGQGAASTEQTSSSAASEERPGSVSTPASTSQAPAAPPEPQADGSFRQVIDNGPYRSVYNYSPDGKTTTIQHYDPQGNQISEQERRTMMAPPAQQGQAGATSLHPAEIAVLRQRAMTAIGPPHLSGDPRLDRSIVLQHEKAVDLLTHNFVQARQRELQQGVVGQRQIDVAKAKAEMQKQNKEAKDEYQKRVDHHVTEFRKERAEVLARNQQETQHARGSNTTSPREAQLEGMPEHLKTVDSMMKEAQRLVAQEDAAHAEYKAGGKPKTEEKPPVPPSAPAAAPEAVPANANPALRGLPLTSNGGLDLGRANTDQLDQLDAALGDPKAMGLKAETAEKLRERVRAEKAHRERIGGVPSPEDTGSGNVWSRFKSGLGELPAAAGRAAQRLATDLPLIPH